MTPLDELRRRAWNIRRRVRRLCRRGRAAEALAIHHAIDAILGPLVLACAEQESTPSSLVTTVQPPVERLYPVE